MFQAKKSAEQEAYRIGKYQQRHCVNERRRPYAAQGLNGPGRGREIARKKQNCGECDKKFVAGNSFVFGQISSTVEVGKRVIKREPPGVGGKQFYLFSGIWWGG